MTMIDHAFSVGARVLSRKRLLQPLIASAIVALLVKAQPNVASAETENPQLAEFARQAGEMLRGFLNARPAERAAQTQKAVGIAQVAPQGIQALADENADEKNMEVHLRPKHKTVM